MKFSRAENQIFRFVGFTFYTTKHLVKPNSTPPRKPKMASDYFLEKSLKSLAVKSKSSLSQIKYKHRIFMSRHPTGVVQRKDIIEIFSKILPHKYSENLCDLVLKLFGNRSRNEIDFEKTVMADVIIKKWTIEEKLIWFFNILDRFDSCLYSYLL